ncbi:MAG: lipoyl(octanoyl) transferase LipB [Proteiniphilum sp.]|jgi:lipoyl(octanoyl) transferase|nr:lipoyl(octanoyl) transferase LipB [Proteiniphilum sp.]
MTQKVIFENLGRIRYKEAWDYQEKLFESVIREKAVASGEPEKGIEGGKCEKNGGKRGLHKQYLLFCEHEHVYTLGKHGDKQNLLIAEHACKSRNIDLHTIDRGGDVTYHGPGQLVAYPVIDLELFGMGIKSYISALEDVVIEALESYGIKGEKDAKAMGVWIDAGNPSRTRKICAIGVRASRFVTMHGLALNVNTDLSYFNYINPCGFRDRGVTSMKKELGREPGFEEVSGRMKAAFSHRFGMELSYRLKHF